MIAKILVTLGILTYALLVPLLEINPTHVFNPAWEPHARLHEVWQLCTNTGLGIFCLWLVWIRDNTRLPNVLALLITGGFLLAYLMRGIYGGSMVHSDGSEKLWLGLNLGVLVFGLVFLMSLTALMLERRTTALAQQANT